MGRRGQNGPGETGTAEKRSKNTNKRWENAEWLATKHTGERSGGMWAEFLFLVFVDFLVKLSQNFIRAFTSLRLTWNMPVKCGISPDNGAEKKKRNVVVVFLKKFLAQKVSFCPEYWCLFAEWNSIDPKFITAETAEV